MFLEIAQAEFAHPTLFRQDARFQGLDLVGDGSVGVRENTSLMGHVHLLIVGLVLLVAYKVHYIKRSLSKRAATVIEANNLVEFCLCALNFVTRTLSWEWRCGCQLRLGRCPAPLR